MDRLVTVVIPTFNRKALTDGAIESVVSAHPKLIEVIVVDDCGSVPYAYDAAVNASGVAVQVIRLPSNGGPGMARKAGVEVAKGSYIAFLDSDDRYDGGWLDYAIAALQAVSAQNRCLVISGIVNGERPVGAFVRKALAALPTLMQLTMSRAVATIFNPFYTPSIVVHKDLCHFKDGLRYCEDYYSTVTSLFRADELLLLNVAACHLGRTPNSEGGLSSSGKKMYRGEMEVRRSMLAMTCIPIPYKILVFFGMLYQVTRSALKSSLSFVSLLFKRL